MYIEILLLVIIFILAEITHLIFLYYLLILVFLLCLPGIFALFTAPYVPSLKKNAEAMIKLADVKPGMKVYELGAGDGRLVTKMAEQGAEVVGYEISFALFLFFWFKKTIFFKKGRVFWGNIWTKDISDADVVVCFLMPNAMKKFSEKKFSTMKKGARLVTNTFGLPGKKPKKTQNGVYLYIKD